MVKTEIKTLAQFIAASLPRVRMSGLRERTKTMSEYLFGLRGGWLTKRADKIARKHGAILVNYTDPSCCCGWGCLSGKCKSARRHWFTGPNRGEPFNSNLAAAVKSGLQEFGIPL